MDQKTDWKIEWGIRLLLLAFLIAALVGAFGGRHSPEIAAASSPGISLQAEYWPVLRPGPTQEMTFLIKNTGDSPAEKVVLRLPRNFFTGSISIIPKQGSSVTRGKATEKKETD